MIHKNDVITASVFVNASGKREKGLNVLIQNFNLGKNFSRSFKFITCASSREKILLEKKELLDFSLQQPQSNKTRKTAKMVVSSYSKLHELKLINIGLGVDNDDDEDVVENIDDIMPSGQTEEESTMEEVD